MNVTIRESFTLPSHGKVYGADFDPTIMLRSMTVAEEMKRQSSTDHPYKAMAEIIDDCIVGQKPPISAYDMCIGDYQYLLHKLRTVTHGPEYYVNIRCQSCRNTFEHIINLDELDTNEYDETFKELATLLLPVTGDTVELRLQTPRDLDEIERRKKELKKKFPDMTDDPTIMLNMETMIASVNGSKLPLLELREYIKKLPMRDATAIIQTANDMNRKVGVDINVEATCPKCHDDITVPFRFTEEFFRPAVHK